ERWLEASHSRTAPSRVPVARRVPSGLTASAQISPPGDASRGSRSPNSSAESGGRVVNAFHPVSTAGPRNVPALPPRAREATGKAGPVLTDEVTERIALSVLKGSPEVLGVDERPSDCARTSYFLTVRAEAFSGQKNRIGIRQA